MLPFPVVENLDVFKGCDLHLIVLCVANTVNPLVLEAVEPALPRIRLFRYLHFSSSKSNVHFMSPLADEISGRGEAHFKFTVNNN